MSRAVRAAVIGGLTVVVLGAPASGRAQTPPPVAVALPPEIDRVLRDYERAWRAGDGGALAALFTADGFAIQAGSEIAHGREAIAREIDGPGGPLQLTAYGFSTSGTSGFVVGGYHYAGATGPGGRFVLALSRGPDGRWLIAADLDNTGPRRREVPMDDRQLLSRLNDDYVRSVLVSDVARFEQLLADDFRNTNPDGTILDRAGFLAQIAKPSGLSRLACEDVEIRVLGDTAIVHARTVYETTDGRPGSGRYTDIWQKRDGAWRAVAAHVTRLVR